MAHKPATTMRLTSPGHWICRPLLCVPAQPATPLAMQKESQPVLLNGPVGQEEIPQLINGL